MEIATVPRTLVRQGLRGMRLPLDVAEVVARRVGVEVDDHWFPSVAFEGFEADAKRLVGSLLRDDELVEDGRRQRARATELRQALDLESVADGKRARADGRFERQRRAATGQRRAISEAAREADRAVEDKRRQGHTRVRRQADKLETKIEEVEAGRQETLARVEQDARSRALAEETAAVDKERQAVAAEAEALALEEAEEQVHRERRTGS